MPPSWHPNSCRLRPKSYRIWFGRESYVSVVGPLAELATAIEDAPTPGGLTLLLSEALGALAAEAADATAIDAHDALATGALDAPAHALGALLLFAAGELDFPADGGVGAPGVLAARDLHTPNDGAIGVLVAGADMSDA